MQVGKTSIFRRLIKNQFIEEYKATEGYEFSPYFIKVDNKVIKFQIWDMCGNENYRSVLLNLYRNATLGILVYSVCSRESFDNLNKWIEQLKKNSMPNSKIILIGNKCDDEQNRKVNYEEGKKICEKNNLEFFMEISAKNGFSSPNFMELAAICLVKDYEQHKDESENISLNNNKDESIMLNDSNFNRSGGKCC